MKRIIFFTIVLSAAVFFTVNNNNSVKNVELSKISQPVGSVKIEPVYRFYNPSEDTSYYTKNKSEAENFTKKEYKLMGVSFYTM